MPISKLSSNASLREVMDKFEEISLSDFPNIDIVAKSELSSQVKNGQIVCISNNVNGKIIISIEKPEMMNNGDIWVRSHSIVNFTGEELNVKSKNKIIKLYIKEVFQRVGDIDEKLDCYIGKNDEWIKINKDLLVFTNGIYVNSSITGTFNIQGAYTRSDLENPSSDKTITIIHKGGGTTPNLCMQTNAFDVSEYTELIVDFQFIKKYSTSLTNTLRIGVYDGTGNNNNFNALSSIKCTETETKQVKVDISQVSGLQSIKIKSNLSSTTESSVSHIYAHIKISNIKLR